MTQAYTIQINEYQRKLLAELLGQVINMPAISDAFESQPGEMEDNALEELDMLYELFEKLAEAERETPGALHGFCV